jgi:hypothetical protein
MTLRWQFYDRVVGDTYTVEYNPDTMTSPHPKRQTTAYPSGTGRVRTMRAASPPTEWNFGGFIRTETTLNTMVTWAKRGNLMELTDHLNRTWLVRFVQFDEQEQIPTPRAPWKFRYQVNALIYGRI